MANHNLNGSDEYRSTGTEKTNEVPPTASNQRMSAHYFEQTINYWPPGKQLEDGKYTIVQKLSRGGFGITYLAQDNRSGDRVVVKTLSIEYIPPDRFERFRKDFLNEAVRLAKCCHHPHIVCIIELIEEEGWPCIVMDYIPGQDLETIVKQKTLSTEEALRYIREIGAALIAVHQQGLLHRDIKPKNIIIRADRDEAVLIDFGIAREYNPNVERSLTAFMSGGYTPVEQIYPNERENKAGFYTDVYGLAATLYYLVTKTNPEDAQGRVINLTNHRSDLLVNPRTINSEISAELARAICKGMEIYPVNRPQTIQEWLNLLPNSSHELEREQTLKIAATQPQNSHQTQSLLRPLRKRKLSRKSKRHLVWIIGGALSAIALSIGAIVVLQRILERPTPIGSNSNSTVEFDNREVAEYSNYGIKLKYPKDWAIKQYEPNEFTQIVAELIPPSDRASTESIQPKVLVEVRQLTKSYSIDEVMQGATEEIQKYLPNSNILEKRKFELGRHPAYWLTYTGLDEKNTLQRMQVGVLKSDRLYILTYEAKVEQYKTHESTVQSIVNSFDFSQ
jgi:serine/threonine-protein kinase